LDRLDFDRDGRDWPHRSSSQFMEAGGVRWHVQTFGDGPDMLLLHGTGASGHSWRRIAPILASRFKLIIPDLPGHGFTSYPASNVFTLPGMAGAVASLMQALGASPAVAVGHSAGAAIAVRMVLDGQATPRALIGVNAALHPFRGFAGQFFSPLAKLMVLNPLIPRLFAWRAMDQASVARLLEGTGSAVAPDDVEFYRRLFSSPGHCAAALAMMARWDLEPLVRDLPKLVTPLTLIVGENDKAVPPADAQVTKLKARNAKIAKVADAGHLAHEERAPRVVELIFAAAG
jgi:magnesium chelatase accessory protein